MIKLVTVAESCSSRTCCQRSFGALRLDRIDREPSQSYVHPNGGTMKQSQHFLEDAENCAQLAERAADESTYNRYKRMEAAWRALAVEQD
jgi:hypothetical protein